LDEAVSRRGVEVTPPNASTYRYYPNCDVYVGTVVYPFDDCPLQKYDAYVNQDAPLEAIAGEATTQLESPTFSSVLVVPCVEINHGIGPARDTRRD
jgi:hypothetical protein